MTKSKGKPMGVELVNVSGEKVRSFRKRLGWSQELLADAAGVSRSYLAEIELGQKLPRPIVARAISDALGIDLGMLLDARKKSASS
jgi:transcriptional regulator with XRE-family HTH domain